MNPLGQVDWIKVQVCVKAVTVSQDSGFERFEPNSS